MMVSTEFHNAGRVGAAPEARAADLERIPGATTDIQYFSIRASHSSMPRTGWAPMRFWAGSTARLAKSDERGHRLRCSFRIAPSLRTPAQRLTLNSGGGFTIIWND